MPLSIVQAHDVHIYKLYRSLRVPVAALGMLYDDIKKRVNMELTDYKRFL